MQLFSLFALGSSIPINDSLWVVSGQPCSTAEISAAISHSISEIFPGCGARDSVSATTSCLPGKYCASGLYRIIRINNCWQQMGTLSRSHVFISGTSGLWSVNNLKLRPRRYLSDFSQNQTPAKHSFLICEYPFSAWDKVGDANATGRNSLP